MSLSIPAAAWRDPNQSRVMKEIETTVRTLNAAVSSLATPGEPLQLVQPEQTHEDDVLIEFADNKPYMLIAKSAFERTIDSVTTIASTGTCTVDLTLDGVSLGGGSNAASTSLVTVPHTSANVLPVDGVMVLTVSGNASCEGLAVCIKYRRTFTLQ